MRWNEIVENELDDWDQEVYTWLEQQSLDQTWYLGTNRTFSDYDQEQVSKRALFFTTSKDAAEYYAKDRASKLGGDPIVVKARLDIKKPFYTLETNDYRWDIEDAKSEGFDAVVGPAHSGMHPPLNAVVFSLDQVQQIP